MTRILTYLNVPIFKHLLFWSIVFFYFILSVNNMSIYSSSRHLYESYGLIVLAQIITAYTCIYVLMPKFLDKKKTGLFIFWMIILLVAVYALYQAIKVIYFDVVYFDSYNELQKEYALEPYLKRLTDLPVLFSKSMLYLTPAALLLLFRFYSNQQKYLKLNEQKKIAELSALRNQLNPHFLFNTLNNLYALALDKSDKTPEVIEGLSEILDYILYRCKANYVPLQKEIELIENYIALEKIRYGNRVELNFDHNVDTNVNIAPLILLTFVENAFKHGVSQELKEAKIEISLTTNASDILFSIRNTKPKNNPVKIPCDKESLGIKNVKQQLDLLYSHLYNLKISNTKESFEVVLKLKTQ